MQLFEVILKTDLVEFHSGSLEEAVFEVVQIEHHHPAVESRFREADIEIKPFGAAALDFREHFQGVAQH